MSAVPHVARGSFDRVREALEAADCRPRGGGDRLDARCPAHEDRKPSLRVDWRPDPGRVLIRCHAAAGCTTEDVAAALGLEPRDLYDEPWEKGTRRSAPGGGSRANRSSSRRGVSPGAGGARRAPLPATPPDEGSPRPRVVAEYTYTDEAGELLGVCQRLEPKSFRWRRPRPGGRGWVWGAPERRPLYRLPDVLAAIGAGELVYVVEGEKDADALTAAGVTATCNANGATSPETPAERDTRWVPEHTATLAGAAVVIVADRDAAGYGHALALSRRLAGVAASVTVVEATAGKDAADHLAAGHPVASLVSVPVEALEAGDLAWRDGVDPVDLEAERRRRRGGGGSGDGGEVDRRPAVVRDEYEVIGDAIVKQSSNGRGRDRRVTLTEVLNARVRVARRVRRDLGDSARVVVSHVDLVAERGEGDDLVRVEVPGVEVEAFNKLTWADDLPWPDVAYRRTHQGRSDVINGIVTTSTDVETVTAYGSLGWRQLDSGDWAYVHAGGAIGATGTVEGVRVDVPGELAGHELPAPPVDAASWREAVRSSLAIMDAIDLRFAAPLLGATYRSLLGESRTSLFFVGAPGSAKSAMVSLGARHFVPAARYDRLPFAAGEAASTTVSLEELRYLAGHSLFACDDLAPDRGAERAAARANELLRSQFNGTGKTRSKRDGGLRASHPPRGLLALTGEDGASVESAESRGLYLPTERIDEDRRAALEALDTPELATGCATLTAGLAQHYAAAMGDMPARVRQLADEFGATLRDPSASNVGLDTRQSVMLGDCAAGWDLMLSAAIERGALTEDEAGAVWERVWAGLLEAKRYASRALGGRSLPERAAELFRSVLDERRVYLESAGRDGHGRPEMPERWGWAAPSGLGDVFPSPGATRIGWVSVEGDRLWLNPAALFRAIEAQGKSVSDPLRVTPRALAGALAGAGLLAVEPGSDSDRYGARRYARGVRRRVWDVPVSWVYPPDEDGEADGPGDGRNDVDPPTFGPLNLSAGDPAPTADQAKPAESHIGAATPLPASASVLSPREADERTPDRPAAAGSTDYVGVALVVDVDRAYLAGTATAARELATPPATLAELLTWAEAAPLGVHHDYARDDYGQVWLTAAAAKRYGLPTRCPSSESAAAKLAAVRELEAAGWQLGKNGLSWWWVKAYRPGGRTVNLAVSSWATAGDCPLLAGTPAPAELAGRIAGYLAHVGTAWHISSGVTGIRVLELSRTRAPIKVTEAVTPPPVCKRGRSDVAEVDLLWQRAPEPDELAMKWVHAYDLNGMYLAAASSVRVGLGAAEHRQEPAEFDPTVPGYWRITPPEWRHARLPDPFDPTGRDRRGARWLTTPTLRTLRELGWWDGQVSEAYVWPTIAPAGKLPGVRYFEHWYTRLRDARAELTRELEDRPKDPDATAVLQAVKWTYAHGVGRLDADKAEGQPLYRPDWRHHVIGTARSNLLRKLAAVAERGRYPLAIATDCVLYASDNPDLEAACPPGLTMGTGLGHAHPGGSASMADAALLLAGGKRPDKTALLDLFAEKE